MNQHDKAIGRYNMAASIAVQRPPWEASATMREELSAIVSNRSAAYHGSGDYISALADAETVIQLRKTWPKGYFRKAKALIGLKRLEEGAEALKVGLSYEPENVVRYPPSFQLSAKFTIMQELNAFLMEVERAAEARSKRLKLEKAEESSAPLVSV
jgi:translocation protein SEC72